MADSKITALTALTSADPANDMIPIVDVSDTPPASGNTKRISINNILAASGTATLASATITGAATVGTTLGVTGVSTFAAGTALLPALTTTGDTNTGIFYPAADTFAVTTGGTERYRVNSTGLGIGVSHTNDLHVKGASGGTTIRLEAITDGLLALIGSASGLISGSPANNLAIRAENGLYLSGGGNATQFILNSAGNLGIGVTPSAWNSDYKALQIKGSSLSNNGGAADLWLAANVFVDSSVQVTYIVNAAATRYRQTAGTHIWDTAVAGTGAIPFTQAMTLTAAGGLLVGVASNPNTARAYFRYDTVTTQPVINSASVVAASTSWSHFIGQSGNGSSITTNDIYIYGNGNIQNVNGVYGTISDLRLKENIADARNYLSDLLKLRVVKYSLKEEASAVANKLGFIAQEVEQVFPAMVDTDPNDGNKGIKTSVLIPMLVKAIQELTARVQTLEAR